MSPWAALTLVLRDGRADLDNSAAERAMRPIALGRHNWTFAGSDAGGRRAAAVYSLVETANLHGIDPEATCGASSNRSRPSGDPRAQAAAVQPYGPAATARSAPRSLIT